MVSYNIYSWGISTCPVKNVFDLQNFFVDDFTHVLFEKVGVSCEQFLHLDIGFVEFIICNHHLKKMTYREL